MNTQNEESMQTEEGMIYLVGLLEDYFRTLRRMWIWVLILAVLGGAFSYIRSYVTWSPRYTASSILLVTKITVRRSASQIRRISFCME